MEIYKTITRARNELQDILCDMCNKSCLLNNSKLSWCFPENFNYGEKVFCEECNTKLVEYINFERRKVV